VERARSWDDYLQAERDRIAVQEARKWERRRQQALETNWLLSGELREKLKAMLAWPIARQKTAKDGTTIIFDPARWSYQTVALLAKTAAELGAAVLLAVGKDPDELTDAEARAITEDPDWVA
jgi:hypothetical protein